jgi:ATP-dependent DNA helicase RecQ
VLEVKKMAPSETGAMRKLPDDVRPEEGRALARLGDGGWDPLLQSGLRAGRLDDELVGAAAEIVRGWNPPVAWVAAVPSRRGAGSSPSADAVSPPAGNDVSPAGAGSSPVGADLVTDFAARLAAALDLPFAAVLARTEDRPPQREMANSAQQVANVRGAFAVTGALPEGAALLVDDIRFSGWTLAMVAGQLRRRGSGPVHPLALATAF